MTLKVLSFIFVSLFYTSLFVAYHPDTGWSIAPSLFVLATFLLIFFVFTMLSLLTLICRFIDPKGRVESLVLASLLTLFFLGFFWVQFDFLLKTLSGFTTLRLTIGWLPKIILALVFSTCVVRMAPRIRMGSAYLKKKYLLVLPALFFACAVEMQIGHPPPQRLRFNSSQLRPVNVIILTFDSLDQKYLDFGTQESRDTFPFLRSKLGEFLNATASFPNACCTHGATAALYTGLPATQSQVIHTPGQLHDSRVDLNLPALLKAAGYETHSFVSEIWGNPFFLGIAQAFDYINGRQENPALISELRNRIPLAYDTLPAVLSLLKNIVRPYHQHFLKIFADEYVEDYLFDNQLFTDQRRIESDDAKINSLLKLLARKKQPLFAHYQFMGLHGRWYNPAQDRIFFQRFDTFIEKVYTTLVQTQMLDQTILILNADHGKMWTIPKVPLMIRFPHAEYAGVINANTQTLDIAPTLVDYLHIDSNIPFAGHSLLRPHTLDPLRPIIIAKKVKKGARSGPPNYQISKLLVIRGVQSRELDSFFFKTDQAGNIVF